jgi:hypothetical protein
MGRDMHKGGDYGPQGAFDDLRVLRWARVPAAVDPAERNFHALLAQLSL